MLLFLCGMGATAAVFIGIVVISAALDNRKRARSGREYKQDKDHERIDNLETGCVLLNKRADCALVYTDKVMETHEEVFHKPKQDKKK